MIIQFSSRQSILQPEPEIKVAPVLDATGIRIESEWLMMCQSNLVALDKTIAAIRRSRSSYAAAAARTSSISERILRAIQKTGELLP